MLDPAQVLAAYHANRLDPSIQILITQARSQIRVYSRLLTHLHLGTALPAERTLWAWHVVEIERCVLGQASPYAAEVSAADATWQQHMYDMVSELSSPVLAFLGNDLRVAADRFDSLFTHDRDLGDVDPWKIEILLRGCVQAAVDDAGVSGGVAHKIPLGTRSKEKLKHTLKEKKEKEKLNSSVR